MEEDGRGQQSEEGGKEQESSMEEDGSGQHRKQGGHAANEGVRCLEKGGTSMAW